MRGDSGYTDLTRFLLKAGWHGQIPRVMDEELDQILRDLAFSLTLGNVQTDMEVQKARVS